MSNAEKVRSTIKSTEKTKKITGAMELVAASKLGKTQKHMTKSKPYSNKILEVMGHIATSHSEYKHPFILSRVQRKNIGYIIVSSDRGLCGSLNHHLFKETLEHLQQWQQQNIKFCLIGNKATSFFSKFSGEVIGQKSGLGDNPKGTDTIGIIQTMLSQYLENNIDAIFLCYNQFVSTMHQKPKIMQLVPLEKIPMESNPQYWDYIYEPDAKSVIDILINRYLESVVHQAVIENIACEQAARMIAMKNATDNANDIIDDLRLLYNKARQAAITQELSEIIGGSEAI